MDVMYRFPTKPSAVEYSHLVPDLFRYAQLCAWESDETPG